MNAPCKGCEERHHNCHSQRETYQAYSDECKRRCEENWRRNEVKRYQRDFHDRYLKKTKGRK
jgi:hypothetical protein